MNRYVPLIPVVIIVAALIAFGVWYQSFLWNECRGAGHTFFYCLHVIGR